MNKFFVSVLLIVFVYNANSSFASSTPIDLTDYLPKGYVKDGTRDYTIYIQKGLNENSIVRMPNFPVSINYSGLKIKSNSQIFFQDNSVIYMLPNDKPSYAVLYIHNVQNVEIWNPRIVGDKYSHMGTKGEWGMGIQIRDSRNIKIFSPVISKCWGDGIYIGGEALKGNNGIFVDKAHINDCRRNGMSITEGVNVEIINPLIENINGTSPKAGIDIEPNNSNANIDNIKIINPHTKNNGNFGIVISLGALPSSLTKNVNIRIDNHIDEKSHYAFCLAAFRGKYEGKRKLNGQIHINNPKWYNNKIPFTSAYYEYGPMTIFNNVQIYKTGFKFKNGSFSIENQLSTKDIYSLKERINKKYKNVNFK